ncbi:hypothetical protein AWB67_05859 [Caballeronia terrestris]|uniref:Uncharacterized protein n=1 Tax=Caballeronia terrestris TaxID=1226301 RepID=A0A158KK51_9BURK|nr:hypothetical protein [Caballeronia terrestris]SAL81506.1 hypothetical protein AWB67_05859 [Caballeronia terrestris]
MNLAFIQSKRRGTIDLSNRHDNVLAFPSQRVLVSAAVYSEQDEASRERIRRLFHSPLGVYVSHASRDQSELRLKFDVASEDIEKIYASDAQEGAPGSRDRRNSATCL